MKTVKNVTFSAMLLALCMVLPIITGGIPQIGNALSPMHIPVFICGFVCGWQYGAVVGFIAPLMRSMIFHAPAMFPTAVSMAFELATYGLVSGILYKIFPQKSGYIYPSLIISMLAGRIVWGIARYIFADLNGSEFSFAMFLGGAFTEAIPGIICHIIIIPIAVITLKKSKIFK